MKFEKKEVVLYLVFPMVAVILALYFYHKYAAK